MKKKFIAALTTCAVFYNAHAQQVEFTSGRWNDIAQKARQENKAIFVDLYFEGCMPCKQMDLTTFKNKEVSEFINTHFISYKTDVFKEEDGKKLALRYAAGGFPTYLFLSADGKIIDITSGYSGAEAFLSFVQDANKATQTNRYKNYAAGLDINLPQFYLDRYLNREIKPDPKAVIDFLDTQKDHGSEVSFLVMSSFSLNEKYNDYYFGHAKELADKYGRMVVRNKMISLVRWKAKKHAEKKSVTDMKATLKHAKDVFTDKEWERFSKLFWEDYYKLAGDYTGLADYIKTSGNYDLIDKIYLTTTTVLQSKNKDEVARGLLKLYDQNSKDFDQLYTAAWLQFYAGEKVAAKSLLEKAQNAEVQNEKEKEYPAKFLAQLNTADFKPPYLPRAKPMRLE